MFWTNMVNAVRVMKSHETVVGTITQLLPMNHQTVVASYAVNGAQFTTATSLPDRLGLPPFDQLKVGDKVQVECNPAQPAHGILGSADKLVASNVKDIGVIAIFLVFAAAYIEFNFRRYFLKSRNITTGVDNPSS
jgi:hypothetical protein